jgi:cell division protein FtsB
MTGERHGFGLGRFLILAVVVLVVVGASGIFPFRQILAQNRSVDLAQEQLDALTQENRRLEQEIAALQSPQEVERMAREQFGLVRPGEIAYVAVAPEGDASASDATASPRTFEKSTPWWRSLWNFLTGSDLVKDG